MIEVKQHPDGEWLTTEHMYKGLKILIKSRKGGGIKAHVFYSHSDRVDFTLRYCFINPDKLLEKVKKKIDNER